MTRHPLASGLHRLTDFGTVNGYHLRGSEKKHLLIVDDADAIACTPLEYQVATHLLRSPGVPVPREQVMAGATRRTWKRVMMGVRRTLRPLGIRIVPIKTYGYLLVLSGEEPDQAPRAADDNAGGRAAV